MLCLCRCSVSPLKGLSLMSVYIMSVTAYLIGPTHKTKQAYLQATSLWVQVTFAADEWKVLKIDS